MTHSNPAAKAHYHGALTKLASLAPQHWPDALVDIYHADLAWHGPHPINSHAGAAAVIDNFWRPFLAALPDLERRDDILLAGEFKQAEWVGATGYYTGTFSNDWLGIPATGQVLNVRYGEFSRLQDGKVCEVYLILDMLDVLRQAGCWPSILPRSPGPDDRVPGPGSMDGVQMTACAAQEGQRSLELVEAMIKGLMTYDGQSLESMGQERFWHPRMMWYGPSGIGTSRGLKGFQDVHQRTFLKAFPDRVGGDHKARIGEGAYVGSTGWPSVRATHRGSWLGVGPTNQRIGMRVMDFWRREDDLLRENWVFIDQLDLLLQMGCDVMGSLK